MWHRRTGPVRRGRAVRARRGRADEGAGPRGTGEVRGAAAGLSGAGPGALELWGQLIGRGVRGRELGLRESWAGLVLADPIDGGAGWATARGAAAGARVGAVAMGAVGGGIVRVGRLAGAGAGEAAGWGVLRVPHRRSARGANSLAGLA